ncbi:hypothetical protein SRIMM317S_00603 [Streptomyces rimosus subsp. rimosus]
MFLEDEPTREHLRRTLFAPGSVRVVTSPAARPLVPGRARGVTLGGCLSLLAADLARRTPARSPPGACSCWRTWASPRTAWTVR